MEKHLTDLFSNQKYNEDNFFLIAGPCVVESEEIVMGTAEKVAAICARLEMPYIFKACYRKANVNLPIPLPVLAIEMLLS